MLKLRLKYIFWIIIVIITGLASRKMADVPLWIGDILWALMIYLIVRTLLITATVYKTAAISLTFCFLIEFSQLYTAPGLTQIGATLFGRLILGQGFLWGDLLAYTIGVLAGIAIDRQLSIENTGSPTTNTNKL